ncbi:MAG: DNA-directed DNA polymerase [archaeon]
MKIKFIPLDYDYLDIDGKTVVRVFGRSWEGKRCCILDRCDAFFWVIPKSDLTDKELHDLCCEIEKIKAENAGRKVSVESATICKKNFLGKEVKAIKVVVSNHKDMGPVSEAIRELNGVDMKREIDIPHITRYILEKNAVPLCWHNVEGEILNNSEEFRGMDAILNVDLVIKANKITYIGDEEFKPKVMAFDIESDDFEIGKGNILMISMACGKFRKVLTFKKAKAEDYVEFCKDEAEMIERFCECIKKEKPDILTGYFSDGFDMPYLRARAEKNKVRMDIGLDNSQPTFSRGRLLNSKVTGIVHVDLFKFVKTAYSQYLQSETLSLDEVASELIGERKHEFKNKLGSKIEEHEWKDFFAYNMQDSAITEKLFNKLWPDLLEFSRVMQEPLYNVSRDSFSQHVENYIIHNLGRFNEIAEHRPTYDTINERKMRKKYEGAFVLQPKPALYENLAVFDFTSLYPSIIVSFNLSLSTLEKNKCKDCHEIGDVEVEGEKKKIYFSKKEGFMPLLIGEIIKKRKEMKKQLKENHSPLLQARSNAFKTLANAAYGYLGFFGARYYCVEAAAATAALGRKFIHDVIEKTNKQGFNVIYADTDGFAFSLNNNTKDDTLSHLKKLNSQLPGMMELELESFYKRGIFVTKRSGEFGAKKKYALLTEKDQLKIRGFETVRRDWCELAREVQNNILKNILNEGKADSSLKYVKEIIDSIKKRKTAKEKLIIRTQLKKSIEEYLSEGPHVAIAKKMIERGIPVDSGMLIEFYIAEGSKKQLIRERARLPDEEEEYDIDYYIEHQIIPAVETIFAVFGIGKDEIIKKEQKKLLDF